MSNESWWSSLLNFNGGKHVIILAGGFPARGLICCEDCDDRDAAENEA